MKLTIEKVIYGGQGLARIPAESGAHSGMRVFAPFTLPEETVEAQIVEEHRGYCVADVHAIERSSPFRTAPPCPWFGICGGCQLQHATYDYQVELKREMLAESLTRAGISGLPPITSLTGAPFGYRNRVRLQVESQPEFAIGYRQAKSHRIVAIDHCPVAAPLLSRCIAAMAEMGLQHSLPLGLDEIEIFTNHDQSELLLSTWTPRRSGFERNDFSEFFAKLQQEIPQLTGAIVLASEKQHGRSGLPLLRWGKQNLRYRVGLHDYTVGLGSFFQINATLVEAFVAAVVDAQRGESAWDLYAGVGLFSLALASGFQRVVAVESNPSALDDLHKNLHDTSGVPASSTILEFLQQASLRVMQRQERSPDLVVLDPPRAGAGVESCRLLVLCNPRRIVYVSCDPATLGRDLAALIQSGYRLQRLQLVDMFPQTGHLETIAMLER